MKYQSISVRFAHMSDASESPRWDDSIECETVKQARILARHVLTEDYRHQIEASAPYDYSQVIADGECLSDHWRRDWAPADDRHPDEVMDEDIPAGNLADDDSARHLGDEHEHLNHS